MREIKFDFIIICNIIHLFNDNLPPPIVKELLFDDDFLYGDWILDSFWLDYY